MLKKVRKNISEIKLNKHDGKTRNLLFYNTNVNHKEIVRTLESKRDFINRLFLCHDYGDNELLNYLKGELNHDA